MKRLNLSAVTDSAQLRLKADTLGFLQDANKEVFASLIEALIGVSYDPTKVYILSGLNRVSGSVVASGTVFYNGEVYDVAGLTAGGTFQFKLNVDNDTSTGVLSGNPLDPVTLVGGGTANVHNIRNMILVNDSTGFIDYSDVNVVPFRVDSLFNPNKIITSMIPIGDWNMVANSYVEVNTYIPASSILDIKAIIYNDAGVQAYPLTISGSVGVGYAISWTTPTFATLSRSSGVFDNVNYDSTGYNRGFIIIQHT